MELIHPQSDVISLNDLFGAPLRQTRIILAMIPALIVFDA